MRSATPTLPSASLLAPSPALSPSPPVPPEPELLWWFSPGPPPGPPSKHGSSQLDSYAVDLDFDDELDVYTKVSTVIETLSSFTNQRSEALPALYRRVMDVLVDKKILKHGDAKRACAWFSIP